MSPVPVIRTLAPHEWKTYRDLRLHALADSPEAFGSTLADGQARPEAEWVSRLSAGASSGWDLPLVAEVDGEPIGMSWGRIERSHPETAHLYQMWVAPGHRRLGAGRMLLEAVIAWAKSKDARTLNLGVTLGNSPALHLYTRAGFEPTGEPQPLRQGSDLLEQAMRLKL